MVATWQVDKRGTEHTVGNEHTTLLMLNTEVKFEFLENISPKSRGFVVSRRGVARSQFLGVKGVA